MPNWEFIGNVLTAGMVRRLKELPPADLQLVAAALDPNNEREDLFTALSKLTKRQRAYVDLKAQDPTVPDYQVCKELEIPAKTACSEAVQIALLRTLEWHGEFAEILAEKARQKLSLVLDNAGKGDLTALLRAIDITFKLANKYPAQRHEHTGKDGAPIEIERVVYVWQGDLQEDDGNGNKGDTLHPPPTSERSPRGRLEDPNSRLAP